jgi:putative membrane protein insertion efficiency factor
MKKERQVVVLIFISIFSFVYRIHAQIIVDPELKSLFNNKDSIHSDHLQPLKNSKNEIEIVFSSAFFLYKELISSQDIPKCIFTPSCSEYAIEAIQKKGLIVGWLNTFDRLSRCHSFVKSDYYPFDVKKSRFYDPIQ